MQALYGRFLVAARVALAAFLVPIVVFGNPSMTAAAGISAQITAGGWYGIEWSSEGFDSAGSSAVGFGEIECQGSTKYAGTRVDVANLTCFGGADLSPFHAQPGEPGSGLEMWVESPNCPDNTASHPGSAKGTMSAHESDGVFQVASQYELISYSFTASCKPSFVCISLRGTGLSDDSVRVACTPAPFDTNQVEVPDGCTKGKPNTPIVGIEKVQNPGTSNAFYGVDVTLSVQNYATTNGGWISYHIIEKYPEVAATTDIGAAVNGSTTLYWNTYPGYAAGGVQRIRYSASWTDNGVNAPTTKRGKLVGYGYYWQPTNNGLDGFSTKNISALPTGGAYSSSRMAGVTNPQQCAFYFGQKIATLSTDQDEPTGPLRGEGGPAGGQDQPNPPAPAPIADNDDPGSEMGWLAIIARLLQALVSAVGDVISSLISGFASVVDAIAGVLDTLITELSDLIELLFVPSPDSWDIDGLVDQWQGRPPGTLVTSLSANVRAISDSAGSTSGCGSLGMAFPSAGVSERNLSCPRDSSPVYATVYGLVSAAIFGATALVIFHVLREAVET